MDHDWDALESSNVSNIPEKYVSQAQALLPMLKNLVR